MKKIRILSVCLAMLAIACSFAKALNPSVPPGGNFDLSHWKLTLPTGSSGSPTEISPSALEGSSGFTDSYFFTDTDGSMTFWCPVNGTTTSGSSYPRSELREEINGTADDDAYWTINQFATSELDATCSVLQVGPTKGRVIVGQIHAPNFPFIKLVYEYNTSTSTGSVVAQINQNSTSDDTEADYTVETGIPLNTQFSYVIKTTSSGSSAALTVTINGDTAKQAVVNESAWLSGSSNGMYFKAGDYCQENGSSSTNGCEVSFFALAVTHGGGAPTVTTTSLPGGLTTIPYGNQQLTAAGGTPPYTWSLPTGSLPSGLGLSPAGVISGTPTATGTSNFTVRATDSASATADKAFSIVVSAYTAPSITTTSLPNGTVGTAYSQAVNSSGGKTSWAWTVSTGALPGGLALTSAASENAAVTGSPSTAGTSNFTLKVTDLYNNSATQAYTVTVAAGTQVAAPTFSPAAGTFTSAQSVTISDATSGATIRYTTNGSTPSETVGTVYSSAVSIPTTATLKAIAYKTGSTDSAVTSGTYTINLAGTVTATVGGAWQNTAMTSQTGTFTAAFDATASASPNDALVALSSGAQTTYAGFACIVRFNESGDLDVRNGGAYAAAATVPFAAGSTYHFRMVVTLSTHTYSVYVTPPGGSETTLASGYAFRTEQASVTSLDHWGVFVDTAANGGAGTLAVANFALTSTSQVATPTFSPAAGTFTSAQSVTISDATSGATIRYTVDGSTPSETNGTVYSSAVSIASTATLKAIAYKSGSTDSTVASGTYTISSGGGTYVEAESMTLGSELTIETATGYSGGKYVDAPSEKNTSAVPTNGKATYSFTAPTAGTYYFWARVKPLSLTGDGKSFWWTVNGTWSTSNEWTASGAGATNTNLNWYLVSSVTLAANASTTFGVAYREGKLQWDTICVASSSSFVPSTP